MKCDRLDELVRQRHFGFNDETQYTMNKRHMYVIYSWYVFR